MSRKYFGTDGIRGLANGLITPELALLHELLDERMVHPRGDIPVNRADLIARLVLAHLVEVHPLTLKDAMVLAGQRLANEAVGPNLNLPDLLENLARDHGTGSSSNIFWMTISLVFSSASASYVIATR